MTWAWNWPCPSWNPHVLIVSASRFNLYLLSSLSFKTRPAGPFQVGLLLSPMPGQLLTNTTCIYLHHKNIFICTHHITIIYNYHFVFVHHFFMCNQMYCNFDANESQKAYGIYNSTSFLQTCPAGIHPLAHLNDVWPIRVLREKAHKHMVQMC